MMITLRLRAVSICLLLVFCGGALRAQDAPHVGLKIRTLTPDLRKQHNLGADLKGALVTGVTAGSAAQEKGLSVGDVIVEVGGKPVATSKDLADKIAEARNSDAGSIVLAVVGRGDRREVTLPIAQAPAASKTILPGPK
jgi:serine protease Do